MAVVPRSADYFRGAVPSSFLDVLDTNIQLMRDTAIEAEIDELATSETPLLENRDTRRFLLKLWQSYFNNTTYRPLKDAGYRKLINEYLGQERAGNIDGLFNPVDRAVRQYSSVFDGHFGDEIQIDKKILDVKTGNQLAVDQRLRGAIYQIWSDSNINAWSDLLTRRCATLGSCGLRIQPSRQKVLFSLEHPNIIRDIEEDEFGNVTQLVLEFEQWEGEFYAQGDEEPRVKHSYVEYMSTEKFWMTRDGQWWNPNTKQTAKTKEEVIRQNQLGVVPFVLITQNKTGSPFGLPCFFGNERKIDKLNVLAAHIFQQIRRHVTVTWLVEASGPEPTKIDMGDMVMWYVQKDTAGSGASAKPLVSNLSLSDAIKQQDEIMTELMNSMPELKSTDGQFLSHQSGAGVSNLRLPSEQRIIDARDAEESDLITAQKIGVAYGIMLGLFDVGNGTGVTAAREALETGKLDHRFNKREALPLSTTDKLLVAKADALKKQAVANTKKAALGNATGINGGNNVAAPATKAPAPNSDAAPSGTGA